MRSRTPVTVVILLLLAGFAGCVTPGTAPTTAGGTAAPDAPGAAAPEEPGLLSAPALAGFIAGSGPYNEPSIDITPDGRVFVTAIAGIVIPPGFGPMRSPIWEYNSGLWTNRGANLERNGEYGGGDADLEFDSQGRGYHSDLWVGNDGIAVSKTGNTWTGLPVSHYIPANDRQWFAHYDDQYLYIVTNQIGAGIMSYRADISTALGELGGMLMLQETPLNTPIGRIAPPGAPAVNQLNGQLYVPVAQSDGLWMYRSINHGLTFTRAKIAGAGGLSDVVHFPVTAIDEAGTIYVAWCEETAGSWDIWFTRSVNGGTQWLAPKKVNTGLGASVMPWIVAGEAGKVAVVWYGSATAGRPDSTAFSNADWGVYYAESLNANTNAPTFQQWTLASPTHRGKINIVGLAGEGSDADRTLGDFFSAALSPVDGTVWVAFTRNDPGTPASQHGVWVEKMPAGATPLT